MAGPSNPEFVTIPTPALSSSYLQNGAVHPSEHEQLGIVIKNIFGTATNYYVMDPPHTAAYAVCRKSARV